MKTPATTHPRAGAVLVFALLLLVVGALVLGGVAQMTATQSIAGQTEWTAAQRRINLENSRSMARQYLLERMFFNTPPAGVTNTNPFGGFVLTDRSAAGSFWLTRSETNTNALLNISPFNVMERGGFYRVWIPGSVSDGTTNYGWNFQVRTRSPIAAGYTFVRQRPSTASVGTYGTVPYIDMFNSDRFFGFSGLPRPPVSSVINTNVDSTGYIGFLSAPVGASDAGVFTNVTFTTNNTNSTLGQAVLELTNSDTASTNAVLAYVLATNSTTGLYTNPYTFAVLTNLPIRSVVLQGAPLGGPDKPVHVIVGTNIATLILSNANQRRVYFNMTNDSVVIPTLRIVATNVSWDLGMTVKDVIVNFATTGLSIRGGLRVNQNVTTTGTAPTLTSENDPGGLDVIGDRMMWLEDNRSSL